MKKNLSETHQFGLRMPEQLKEQLKAQAVKKHISLNAELVERLVDSFKSPLHEFSDGELVAELMRRYAHDEIYIRIGKPEPDQSRG